MSKSLKYFFAALLCCALSNAICQNKILDSLTQVLKTTKNDTLKLNTLLSLSEECELNDILIYAEPAVELVNKLLADKTFSHLKISLLGKKALAINNIGFAYRNLGETHKALDYFSQSLKIQEEIDDKEGIATSLNNIGLLYSNKGEINTALDFFNQSLLMWQKLGDKKNTALTLNSIGVLYKNLGDIPRALDYYEHALKLSEVLGNKRTTASSLLNIGAIYKNQGDSKNALMYYQKGLKLNLEINDKIGIGMAYHNIGTLYHSDGDTKNALEYYNKSLKIREELKNKQGIANSLHSIGLVYLSLKKINLALDRFLKGLQIRREIEDKQGLTRSYNNLGDIYFRLKKYSLASAYCDSALVASKELGYPESIKNAEFTLSKIDSATGNLKSSFAHYKQYIIYRDSISNEETRKASTKNQLKYEFQKKESVIIEQQQKERAVAEQKSRLQQIIIASVIFGLILVLIFAAFVFRSLKTTHKQKIIIEEKQKEILDSIYYARRIQRALLTPEKHIEKSLNKLQNN